MTQLFTASVCRFLTVWHCFQYSLSKKKHFHLTRLASNNQSIAQEDGLKTSTPRKVGSSNWWGRHTIHGLTQLVFFIWHAHRKGSFCRIPTRQKSLFSRFTVGTSQGTDKNELKTNSTLLRVLSNYKERDELFLNLPDFFSA